MATRQDRIHMHAQSKDKVAKRGVGSRMANMQPAPTIGSGTSSFSSAGIGSSLPNVDQQSPLVLAIIHQSPPHQHPD